MSRVHHDPQVLPLGLRCLYQGAQGQTVVVSDIKMWHTLALLAGLIMMVWGGSLPFIRRRHFRVLTPGPKAARPL